MIFKIKLSGFLIYPDGGDVAIGEVTFDVSVHDIGLANVLLADKEEFAGVLRVH